MGFAVGNRFCARAALEKAQGGLTLTTVKVQSREAQVTEEVEQPR